jgi:hypothetical protein
MNVAFRTRSIGCDLVKARTVSPSSRTRFPLAWIDPAQRGDFNKTMSYMERFCVVMDIVKDMNKDSGEARRSIRKDLTRALYRGQGKIRAWACAA